MTPPHLPASPPSASLPPATPPGAGLHLAVVMTCFNRRDKTLACLQRLHAAQVPGLRLSIHLVDDGSTDGTGDAVRAAYPQATVIRGSGNLYWNGGMHLAMASAMAGPADALLWLNDDTMLYPDALARMLALWQAQLAATGQHAVVVGSTQDPVSAAVSYGGCHRQGGLQPLRFKLLAPAATSPLPCDTMNGNCVLLPAPVVARVGNLEPGYLHSMGDLDYGLRCQAAGISLWVLPGFAGQCGNDTSERAARNRPRGLRAQWNDVTGFRKCPPRAWWLFCRRHGGLVGPLVYVKPYAGAVLRGLLSGRL